MLSAVIVYALIGLVGAAEAAAEPDYGVSCVLGASFGALLTVRRDRVATTVGVLGALALLPLSPAGSGSSIRCRSRSVRP